MELNNLLQPIGAPVTSERENLGYIFDTQTERSAISLAHIKNLTINSITAGTITTTLYLGGANILLDGANNRIVINDGTVDRILIGQLTGGF